VRIELFTSAFCDPCHRAREVVAEAQRLVPELVVEELDVAAYEARANSHGVRSTPTMVVRRDDDSVLVTAEGVPTLTRLLTALAEAKA